MVDDSPDWGGYNRLTMTRKPEDGGKGRTYHGLTASNPAKTQLITPEANRTDHGLGEAPESEDAGNPVQLPVAPEPDLLPPAPAPRRKPRPESAPEPVPEKKSSFSDLSLSDLVVQEDSISQISTMPRLPAARLPHEPEGEEEEDEEEQGEVEEEASAAEEVEEAPPPEPKLAMPVAVDPLEATPIDEEQVKNWAEVTPVPLDKLHEPARKPPPGKKKKESEETPASGGEDDEKEVAGASPRSLPRRGEDAGSREDAGGRESEPIEGWSSWPGQRPSEVEAGVELTAEEVAKLEDARFAPPPEDSLPGLLFPNATRPRPIGNIYSTGQMGGRTVPGEPMQDWRGYPSRIIDRFLQSEGRSLIFIAIAILVLALAAAGWWLRDPLADATGLDLEDRRVEITVHTVPRDAMLYLDGELVRRANGEPGLLRLAPSTEERFLRVQAPGYPDRRVGFVADQNRALTIKLESE